MPKKTQKQFDVMDEIFMYLKVYKNILEKDILDISKSVEGIILEMNNNFKLNDPENQCKKSCVLFSNKNGKFSLAMGLQFNPKKDIFNEIENYLCVYEQKKIKIHGNLIERVDIQKFEYNQIMNNLQSILENLGLHTKTYLIAMVVEKTTDIGLFSQLKFSHDFYNSLINL